MKKVYRLAFDDFDAEDYSLIAIHSGLEAYRLAYFLNRELSIRLQKCPADVAYRVDQGKASFSRFIYEDEANNAEWNLIENKNTALSTAVDTTLFGHSGISISIYLLPEFKNVDYLLKVENAEGVDKAVQLLDSIQYVSAAYTIDHRRLRSKNNLIF